MAPAPLILASRSPRRRDLLSQFGLPFSVRSADVDETPLKNESPAAMTERLARRKSEAVASLAADCWVLGGDTTVTLDGEALGKPANRAEAVAMLGRLSGRRHDVISSVALVGPGFAGVETSHTLVDFMELTPDMIAAYCDTDEPYDKAGGYGIQGPAGTFVRAIRGSYSGVVGLPLYETRMLLHRAGLISG